MEPLFTGNLVELSFLKINNILLVPLLLIELLTLAELTALIKELLFIYTLAGLALALFTLKMGLTPIEGLTKLVAPVIVKLIFVNSPALLALLDCLAELPFIEFSSFRFS